MPARTLYNLFWVLALPFVLLRLAWRARRQPGYLQQLGERFGRYPEAASSRPTIWLHAVSVGETRAAEPLVRALLAHFPDDDIVLTHMTPTGRETAESVFGTEPRVRIVCLAYDFTPFVKRFLAHFRPRLGVVMETELWPNLLLEARARAIPVLLANARLSERSARRYARWPSLAALTLGALDAVAAQTDDDAYRLRAIGAREVEVTGNVKFDIAPPAAQLALARDFRAATAPRQVIFAASTRDGEEAIMLDAFLATAPTEALLVIVPRHPQRFDEVAQLLHARGLEFCRRSAGARPDAGTRVWLGDSMGEMFAWYASADVALIGGSWLPFGGQNLIESCAVGTPVIVGPHTFNFEQVARQAVEAGAARRAQNAAEGMRMACALLADPAAREAMAARGREFAIAHKGATARTVAFIEARLKP